MAHNITHIIQLELKRNLPEVEEPAGLARLAELELLDRRVPSRSFLLATLDSYSHGLKIDSCKTQIR